MTAQNEHVLIEDGNVLHAWSARLDALRSITLGPGGGIVAGPGSANFLVAAQDGNTFYGYSAVTGRWDSVTVTSTSPIVHVDRRCLLVIDGNVAWAFGSETGQWTPHLVPGATVIDTGTGLAWAHSANELRYFSAYTGQWHVRSVPSTALHSNSSDAAFVTNGDVVTAFTARLGLFDEYTSPTPGPIVNTNGDMAVVQAGDDFACYDIFRGEFRHLNLPSGTLRIDAGYALIENGSTVAVYSAATGGFAPAFFGSYSFTLADHAILAEGASTNYVYGTGFNDWVEAPAYSSAKMLTDGIVFETANGYAGFSSRYPRFAEIQTSASATYQKPSPRGSTCLILDQEQTWAWSPRFGTFERQPIRSNTIAYSKPAFSGAILENGNFACGFGIHRAAWVATKIAGNVLAEKPGSGVGYVLTDRFLYAHSNYGTLTSQSLYPEGTGETLVGGKLVIQQVAPIGSRVFGLMSRRPARQATAFGTLFVHEPAIWTTTLPTVPETGHLDIEIAIPQNPAFSGVSLHLQNLVVTPDGRVFLSTSVSPVIL